MQSDELAARGVAELLPCPFCGCTTIKTSKFNGYDLHYHECDWCGAEGPAEAPDADPPQGWNVRATPAALAEAPEVQAMIREAEARGMERAAETASLNSWKHEGEDAYSKGMDAGARHQAKVIYDAIRAEAAALRGKGE